MREIRRINADELPLVQRVQTLVFNRRHDYSGKGQPDPPDALWEWGWAALEHGKIVSVLMDIPYLMRFDGHSVRMAGVGGVGTLPEGRKGGNIRRIFEKLLPEAYEGGAVFSCLNPFSHAFYRRFGYELACARNEAIIPVREFEGWKVRGGFTQIFPGDDTEALQTVHQGYIADLNHGICRDFWPGNRAWRIFTRDDPYVSGIFLYLWRDDAGRPRAYIKYEDQKKDDVHILSVLELAFIDRDALYGALSLIGGLGAQFKIFRWVMPTFIDPADFITGLWDITQRIIPHDMTRVVNVRRALELMRRPEGEGAYVLEVTDGMLPANQGRYAVEYGPEGSRVSPTTRDADIRCDIPVLSQLITGYRTLENALRTRRTGLDVPGSREILDKVFTLRPQHITEHF
jgi:predicted acetyltransferase